MESPGIYWNLKEILYQRRISRVTEFRNLMKQHGINLSYSQSHALVNKQPSRVTLKIVLTVCKALNCSINDLILLGEV